MAKLEEELEERLGQGAEYLRLLACREGCRLPCSRLWRISTPAGTGGRSQRKRTRGRFRRRRSGWRRVRKRQATRDNSTTVNSEKDIKYDYDYE